MVQYIGEICRYLLAQPDKPQDKQHHVRLAFGNGLRPQIWMSFKGRFNIEQIGEFYGATEGNANLGESGLPLGTCTGYGSTQRNLIPPLPLLLPWSLAALWNLFLFGIQYSTNMCNRLPGSNMITTSKPIKVYVFVKLNDRAV